MTPILVSATFEYKDGRIWFVKSPYSLKDEIKAMRGSKWHGYEEENPRKIWSVEDFLFNHSQLVVLLADGHVEDADPLGLLRQPTFRLLVISLLPFDLHDQAAVLVRLQ